MWVCLNVKACVNVRLCLSEECLGERVCEEVT